jgi:preprotein translocase subunit SecY
MRGGTLLRVLALLFLVRAELYLPLPGLSVDVPLSVPFCVSGWSPLVEVAGSGGVGFLGVGSLWVLPYVGSLGFLRIISGIFPRVARWKERGVAGTQGLYRLTRYASFCVALLLGALVAIAFVRPSVFDWGVGLLVRLTLAMASGSAIVTWVVQRVDREGLASGLSLVVFVDVVSSFWSGVLAPGSVVALGSPVFVKGGLLYGIGCIAVGCLQNTCKRVRIVSKLGRDEGMPVTSTYIEIGLVPGSFGPVVWVASIVGSGALNLSRSGGSALLGGMLLSVVVVSLNVLWATARMRSRDLSKALARSFYGIPGIRSGETCARYLESTTLRVSFLGGIGLSLFFFPLVLGFGGSGRVFSLFSVLYGVVSELSYGFRTRLLFGAYGR